MYVVTHWDVHEKNQIEIQNLKRADVANDDTVRALVRGCRTRMRKLGCDLSSVAVLPFDRAWPDQGIHVVFVPSGKGALPLVMREVSCS